MCTPGVARPVVLRLGVLPYRETLERMRSFTASRGADTPDQIWLLEHHPVYTLGQAGRREHLHDPGDIPVVHCDRGGQVTYHGPGQVVLYTLLDLRRRHIGVRSLVELLEQSVIDVLAAHGVPAARRPGAPGVYVDGAKIAALGLRVSGGCSYHGLAVNVRMDLSPFSRMDPCGYAGLPVTQVSDHAPLREPAEVATLVSDRLLVLLEAAGEPAAAGRGAGMAYR